MVENFVGFLGFGLGVLIVCVTARMLFAPFKFVLKIFLNSVIGALVLVLINLFSGSTGFFIGINPLNALITGILGLPGLILLILLQIVF